MNEKELSELMQNIDYELIEKEIDELTNNIEINMESISAKAHEKLEKENLRMKKRKRLPIIAAALIAVLSVSAAYASEISDFVKSFFNKREIYSTVVDGDAFYLEAPVQLDENNRLDKVIFTKDELSVNLTTDMKKDNVADFGISIIAGGITYIPGGYGTDGADSYMFGFFKEEDLSYAFFPTNRLTFNIGGESYDIDLSEGEPVNDKGGLRSASQAAPGNENNAKDAAEDEAGSDGNTPIIIDWINVGFRGTEKGVQIITSFEDDELNLDGIGNPTEKSAVFMSDFKEGIMSASAPLTDVLIGYDKDGNAYKYDWDREASGRPVTIFESDAPGGAEIELIIPSLIIGYDYKKEFPEFSIDIPDLNQEITVNREIDFIVQKMVLKSIKRTSETTAELEFDLNTGDKKEAFIRSAFIWSKDLKKAEGVWEDNTGKVTVTFDEGLKSAGMSLYRPSFVVKGNWSLILNSQE